MCLESDWSGLGHPLFSGMIPKFVPMLVMVAAASLYYAPGRRMLISAVWLAAALGFLLTRLLHF